MGNALKKSGNHPGGPGSLWWESPGTLRTTLLRLDGGVGAVVNAEKHLAGSAAISVDLARHLGRLVQQMGLDAENGVVEQSGGVPGFEPVKPGFTREAGSFRRQVPPQGPDR